MSNYTEIQKSALEQAREARTKAEATKYQLLQQEEEIKAQCRAMGVEPEQLDERIAELDTSIQENCRKVDKLIQEGLSAKATKKERKHLEFTALKGRIREKKSSYREIASELGIATSTLSDKINGYIDMSLSDVVGITEILDIKPLELTKYFFSNCCKRPV